jgi:peroxiredoxin
MNKRHTVEVLDSRLARALELGAALLVGALAIAGCSGGTNAVDQTAGGQFRYVGSQVKGTIIKAEDRKTAGDATAPFLNGSGDFRLSSVKGQVAVLNFWATYCGPCVTESPAFDKLYRATKATGVTFVGIDVKDVSKSKAKAFIADNDISYPIVYDQTAKTALQLGRVPASSLPSTVVIDKLGRVAAVYVGAVQAGDLAPVLTTLVDEK